MASDMEGGSFWLSWNLQSDSRNWGISSSAYCLKNFPERPSGPGVFPSDKEDNAWVSSSCIKGASSCILCSSESVGNSIESRYEKKACWEYVTLV